MAATEIAPVGAKDQDKDEIVFVTKDDEEVMEAEVNKDDSGHQGAVGPDGEIDWDCPCLNGMASGPCGQEFKDAFSCFVHSEDEPKGSGCMGQFKVKILTTIILMFDILCFVACGFRTIYCDLQLVWWCKVMHDCIEANAEYFEEKRNERDAQLAAYQAAREREESEKLSEENLSSDETGDKTK
eukprot:m.46616 g.46616  ORF g.46616 m.46616 type:complete len:184 (-) comp15173_c0_seq1:462-1013(-)